MFQFEVYGIPVPQKQTQFFRRNGEMHGYNPSSKDIKRLQWQIKPFCPPEPLAVAIELTIAFFLPIPKSAPRLAQEQMKNRIILPQKKPDVDNLAYLVTNALKGIVYDDDKRICAQHIYKFYGIEPKTVIRVRPILTAQDWGYQDAVDL